MENIRLKGWAMLDISDSGGRKIKKISLIFTTLMKDFQQTIILLQLQMELFHTLLRYYHMIEKYPHADYFNKDRYIHTGKIRAKYRVKHRERIFDDLRKT